MTTITIPPIRSDLPDGPVADWITHTLWSRWGWQGFLEDACHTAYRDEHEKARIESAVLFTLRALAHSPTAAPILRQITARRATIHPTEPQP